MSDAIKPAQALRNGRLRLLVTGFGAFPGAPVNPTQAIVRTLEKSARQRLSRFGVDLFTATLPVIYADAAPRIAALIAATQPDLVVHLGLAARRRAITVEDRGRNRLSILHPDAARSFSRDFFIARGGPPLRRTPPITPGLVRAIRLQGVRANASRDAGDYVCNQTLYVTLGLMPRALFIHVPRPRRRGPLRDEPSRAATLAQMTLSIEAAILFAVARLRHEITPPRFAKG